MADVLRTLRTVRHLGVTQAGWLVLRRLQRSPVPMPLDLPLDAHRWARLGAALPAPGPGAPDRVLAEAQAVLRGEFRFLGQARQAVRPDWLGQAVSPLWTYHLHYFDYLVDLAWAFRLTGDGAFVSRLVELASDWIAATGAGKGPGWHPYPIAVRTRRWLQALLVAGDRIGADQRTLLLASVAAQCAVLERRMERHLGANHLQRNLQALVQAGLVFGGAPADRWRARWPEFWRLLLAQVRPDGSHFERSPMYHLMALDDFLEAVTWARAGDVPVPAAVLERLERMTGALAVLARPGGALQGFGDSAAGMAAAVPEVIARACQALGVAPSTSEGLQQLADGGFVAFTGPGGRERMVLTAAPPSPPHQPAHSHADILSFELDLDGRPFLVDRGVSGYDGDPLRAYVRGTRAHNTVMIAGRDQSETWGTFRVGGRATEVQWAASATAGEGFRFEGSYRPWHDHGARHFRVVTRGEGGWRIEDRVEGAAGRVLASHLHFAPGLVVAPGHGGFVARLGPTTCHISPFGADRVHLQLEGHWQCDAFGQPKPAAALALIVDRNDGRAHGWQLLPRDGE